MPSGIDLIMDQAALAVLRDSDMAAIRHAAAAIVLTPVAIGANRD